MVQKLNAVDYSCGLTMPNGVFFALKADVNKQNCWLIQWNSDNSYSDYSYF